MIQVEVQIQRHPRPEPGGGREVSGYRVTRMEGAVLLPRNSQTTLAPSIRVGDIVPEEVIQYWTENLVHGEHVGVSVIL